MERLQPGWQEPSCERYRTTTTPLMPGCSVQLYGKVPAAGNVRETVRLLVARISAGAPVTLSKITLCGSAGKSRWTIPPTMIAVVNGVNVSAGIDTVAEANGLGVTVMSRDPATPPAVAVIVV